MLLQYWRLLRHNANFRRLWLAQVVSEAGDWFYSIAVYTLLLRSTGHATSIVFVLVLQVLPQAFAGPAAGVINDRLSRKQVMVVADLARFVIMLAMLLVRGPSTFWLLYVLIFFETIMAAFFEPAHNAVIPNIVAEEDSITANSLSATTWSFVLALGTLLGGLTAMAFGRDTVFILNALSFLASAIFIWRMQFPEPHRDNAAPFRIREFFDFSPVLQGIRYIRSDVRLLVTVFLKMGTGILAACWVVFPVLAYQVFPLPGMTGERSTTLVNSLLMASRGTGALIGPLITSGWAGSDQSRMRKLALLGFMVAAAGYAALSQAPTLPLACLAVLFATMGGAVIWVNSTTLLQLNSEDRFRGRVFAADLTIAMFTIALAGFTAGRAIDAGVSVRIVVLAIALSLMVLSVTWAIAMRLWQESDRSKR